MEILSVSVNGAYDSVGQHRKIKRFLRKKNLLNPEYLYRGFELRNLEQAKETGIDYAEGRAFFASSMSALLLEFSTVANQNALDYAIYGGGLSIYSAVGFESDFSDQYRFRHENMKPYLVAIVLIEF